MGLLLGLATAGPLLFVSYLLADSSLLFDFKISKRCPSIVEDFLDCAICHGAWLAAATAAIALSLGIVGMYGASTLFGILMGAFSAKAGLSS